MTSVTAGWRWRAIRRQSAQLAEWAKLLILTALASPNLTWGTCDNPTPVGTFKIWRRHSHTRVSCVSANDSVGLEDVARPGCARTTYGALQTSSPGISGRTVVVQWDFPGFSPPANLASPLQTIAPGLICCCCSGQGLNASRRHSSPIPTPASCHGASCSPPGGSRQLP